MEHLKFLKGLLTIWLEFFQNLAYLGIDCLRIIQHLKKLICNWVHELNSVGDLQCFSELLKLLNEKLFRILVDVRWRVAVDQTFDLWINFFQLSSVLFVNKEIDLMFISKVLKDALGNGEACGN